MNKKIAKPKKYNYFRVIQQHYGQGWEDVSYYGCINSSFGMDKETRDLLSHDFKEYRLMGYATRIISRKEKIENL